VRDDWYNLVNMDKRLAKRHKRQVERAKLHTKQSEPDLRTPEQVAAAKEAGKAEFNRTNTAAKMQTQTRGVNPATSTGSAAKTSV
jgi:hypothetical protein